MKHKQLKICHLAPPWVAIPPKNYGGTEVCIYNLAEESARQGHDVMVYATGDSQLVRAELIPSRIEQALLDQEVPWSSHLSPFLHHFEGVKIAKERAEAGKVDVIHIHMSSATDMYLLPLLDEMLPDEIKVKIPIVVTLHGYFPLDRAQAPAGKWTGKADKLFLEYMNRPNVHWITISDSSRRNIPYSLPVLRTIHYGLPSERFANSIPVLLPEELPSDPILFGMLMFMLSSGHLQVMAEGFFLWLGRITPDKGLLDAIEAVERLGAGARLVIAGTVDKNIKEARDYYKDEIVPRLSLGRIHYVGPVNFAQKVNLMRKARALLNPIKWEEPLGLVMPEAGMAGCPVISYERGAAPEIVEEVTGFLVDNVEGMVEAMRKVDTLDRRLVRDATIKRFSVERMTEQYIEVYRYVCQQIK